MFGEFPPFDYKNKDEWTKALGLKPAWADKFIKLIFNQGENAQGAFGNTVIDTYKALLYAGTIDDSTEEKAKEGMQIATDAAQRIFLFRAVSQFIGPAGAASPIFELTDKNLDYFIQVNIGNERQKSGIQIKELDAFYNYCVNEINLKIIGLMVIPPIDQSAAKYFKALNELNKSLALENLSMGMSADYTEAVKHGSNFVRIGSSIFGPRS